MTREQLQARLAEAIAQKEQCLALANQAEGVIIDCNYWLAQLDAEAKVLNPKKAAKGEE